MLHGWGGGRNSWFGVIEGSSRFVAFACDTSLPPCRPRFPSHHQLLHLLFFRRQWSGRSNSKVGRTSVLAPLCVPDVGGRLASLPLHLVHAPLKTSLEIIEPPVEIVEHLLQTLEHHLNLIERNVDRLLGVGRDLVAVGLPISSCPDGREKKTYLVGDGNQTVDCLLRRLDATTGIMLRSAGYAKAVNAGMGRARVSRVGVATRGRTVVRASRAGHVVSCRESN